MHATLADNCNDTIRHPLPLNRKNIVFVTVFTCSAAFIASPMVHASCTSEPVTPYTVVPSGCSCVRHAIAGCWPEVVLAAGLCTRVSFAAHDDFFGCKRAGQVIQVYALTVCILFRNRMGTYTRRYRYARLGSGMSHTDMAVSNTKCAKGLNEVYSVYRTINSVRIVCT